MELSRKLFTTVLLVMLLLVAAGTCGGLAYIYHLFICERELICYGLLI